MAVPRVYVRRGTTVWIGTYSLTHGRTNIDFLYLYTIGPFGAITYLKAKFDNFFASGEL